MFLLIGILYMHVAVWVAGLDEEGGRPGVVAQLREAYVQ